MPVFVGLFAVPWLVTNMVSRTRIPEQYVGSSVDISALETLSGVVSGMVGGLVAAIFPAITAGIGSLVAGHATAQRDERVFIVSQGASRTAYYVGALLLWYVPGLYLIRGGMSSMQSAFYAPRTPQEYGIAIAMVALCGAVALLVSLLLARLVGQFVSRVRYDRLSLGILTVLIVVIWLTMGWTGLLVLTTASGIGMIPVYFKSRRLNCVGVLLVPAFVRCAGLGTLTAHLLGLG
jgi:putative membrane protein